MVMVKRNFLSYSFSDVYKRQGVVRQGHIAQKLGVSDPSAHKMLLQLERLELIAKKRYSSVFVTEKGREAMERYYSSYTRIRKFFADDLRLSDCNCDKAVSYTHLDVYKRQR